MTNTVCYLVIDLRSLICIVSVISSPKQTDVIQWSLLRYKSVTNASLTSNLRSNSSSSWKGRALIVAWSQSSPVGLWMQAWRRGYGGRDGPITHSTPVLIIFIFGLLRTGHCWHTRRLYGERVAKFEREIPCAMLHLRFCRVFFFSSRIRSRAMISIIAHACLDRSITYLATNS